MSRVDGDAGDAGVAPANGVSGMERGRLPNRRSIRLREFDHTENRAYFVTICAMQRLCLFGDMDEGAVRLSDIGGIVECAWLDLPNHPPGPILDAWIVMPNHVHGIIVLTGTSTLTLPITTPIRGPSSSSLGAVIGGFKSTASLEINACHLALVRPIWQRNYFERIIRNDRELEATRRYITENPSRWDADPDHPRHRPASIPAPQL